MIATSDFLSLAYKPLPAALHTTDLSTTVCHQLPVTTAESRTPSDEHQLLIQTSVEVLPLASEKRSHTDYFNTN